MASIGTQSRKRWPDWTARVRYWQRARRSGPDRSIVLGHINGAITFENVDFSYEPGKPVLDEVSFERSSPERDRAGGIVRLGERPIIGLAASRFLVATH